METRDLYVYITCEKMIDIDNLLHFIDVYFNCKYKDQFIVDILVRGFEMHNSIEDVIYIGLDMFNKATVKENAPPNPLMIYYGSGNLPSCEHVDVFLFNDNINLKRCNYVINTVHSDISYGLDKKTLMKNMKRLKYNLDKMFECNYYLNYHKLKSIG